MDIKAIARGKHVLVLEGYCKQCLPFIRGFKELGCEVSVLCGSKWDCGYSSRLSDHKILGICDLHKPEESEKFIIELVKTGKYDIVYPVFEFGARILAHNKEELSKYAIICANDKDVFDRANDKNEVMKVCMENNLPCPQTLFDVKELQDVEKGGLAYPIFIKPRSMFGARGFHVFNNDNELKGYVEEHGLNLMDYVIQECIPLDSEVIAGNVYVDRNGEVKSSFIYDSIHLYPEDGGTSTMNVLIDRKDIHETCAKLVKLMNLRGVIGIDLMIDTRDNIAKVIEINPRASHAITIGFLSGFNLCQQILEDAYEQPVTLYDKSDTSLCLRIGQTDALWWLKSPNRFKKSPRRLGYKKVYEQMFYWDDPMPWFAFLFENLKDYRKKMKEKKQ